MEAAEPILYETLSPLFWPNESSTPPSPDSNDLEPYVVLRNEISLSTVQSSLDGTDAADYSPLQRILYLLQFRLLYLLLRCGIEIINLIKLKL
jgi:hypothetical protein